MEYKAVTGKSLRFKGGSTTKTGGVKKKKTKTIDAATPRERSVSASETAASASEDSRGDNKPRDTRTAAQRKFDDIKRLREARELEKTAGMTHSQRIEAMNTHLSKLSEHNDMPKIGPG